MPVKINLPQVGESVTEGIIGKWLKKVGDTVDRYEPLVEVTTDKVNMEFPSPYNGKLTALLVKEGDTVAMGAPIAEMETSEAVAEAQLSAYTPARQERATTPVGRTGVLLKDTRPVGPTGSGVETPVSESAVAVAPSVSAVTSAQMPSSPAPAVEAARGGQRYSPIVRSLAEQHGVDLAQVKGSGLDGRVTREDVARYVEQRAAALAKAPALAAPAGQAAGPDEEAVPLTPIRRIIAENMMKSATQIPQAWSALEVDVTSLVARRESAKDEFLGREGVPLTYLPFVMKAVAESLKENPRVNSTWGGDKVILKKRIHIGIAVATSQGLVVPVIHNTDSMSIAGLAKASNEIIQRARDGKLRLEDVHGGTFTLNNTGVLGSILTQPLINWPQAAILTTEAIVKRVMVLPGDAIAVRSMMYIGLTFDHRILDGADAGAFMNSVKRRLEAISKDTAIY
ncbi:MAG: 2-oxo acid dehydrogenase subunit E2 [Dehalococcoidia bacterium]|nr:2-oxo acid dehydrogenase subunit E2 [Dehalococcoidia bacterium]